MIISRLLRLLRLFQDYFKIVSKLFQNYFKIISRLFRLFQDYFMITSRLITRKSDKIGKLGKVWQEISCHTFENHKKTTQPTAFAMGAKKVNKKIGKKL